MRDKKYYQKRTKKKSSVQARVGERSAISRLLGEEIREATEEYLTGKREAAVSKFGLVLNQSNLNKIRPMLKKSIFSYVRHFRKDFEGSVEIQNCIYDMFKNFNMSDFVERQWQYRPYYISGSKYSLLQTSIKNPIHISNYDYSQPLYKLANNIEYNPKDLKLHKCPLETVKNDLKFYLSQDENILFAKLINLRYKPSNLKMAKKHNHGLSEEEKLFSVYDNYLYNRSLSISMYVLLDGDPNKAMPFVRYDNDPTPHTNVYIGNDKRREVYGDIALNPHFHFQNEDDSLLCLRKYQAEDGKTKYKTGRCNAIDCKHLKKYLLDLDSLDQKDLERQAKNKMDYNMPFLQYKLTGKKVGVNVDNLFYKFIQDKTDEEVGLLEEISLWLTQSKESKVYNRGKNFDKLIRKHLISLIESLHLWITVSNLNKENFILNLK